MKTLLFNGSPRKNGDCATIIKEILPLLQGEYKIINAYECNIKPCIDCRYCWTKSGCVLQDEMQEVYSYLEECNRIILVSPVYFSELTGPLLSVMSRLQPYYCAKAFRNESPKLKSKRGDIILVGGGDGGMKRAISTAKVVLKQMNCESIAQPLTYRNTNQISAVKDELFMKKVKQVIGDR